MSGDKCIDLALTPSCVGVGGGGGGVVRWDGMGERS